MDQRKRKIMQINDLITTLIHYGLEKGLLVEEDVVYLTNRLLAFLGLDEYQQGQVLNLSLEQLVNAFDDIAVEQGKINDTVTERDLYDTELITVLLDKPSQISKKFYEFYKEDKEKATNWFYQLNVDTNYVKKYRIEKDLKWKTPSEYGLIDITINLSKPEKDPRDIARQKDMPKSNYPICLLCQENQGYKGRLNHPARGNIRLVPLELQGKPFFLQYSPYSYYNEHCIVLSAEHHPMVIDKPTISKLLDFVEFLPHYFVGSNADLPIVGGSILAHEHFQGGHYRFAMVDAKPIYDFKVKGYNANCHLLKWPLSVIRINGKDKQELASLADHILQKWIPYSDEEVDIIAYTDGVRHNTITPIARVNDKGEFELDLVLRNNRTSEAHPMGIFHPHAEYHHIKKENIGLIEVMGLAVLPSRLKTELALLKDYLLNGKEDEAIEKHHEWVEELKTRYSFTKENVQEILEKEIGLTFAKILECAGVYKQNEKGIEHFKKFVSTL